MPWWNRNKKKTGSGIETKGKTTIPIAPNSFVGFALTGAGRVSAHQAMGFYQDNAAIATAVDLIGDSFEQIEPVLEHKDRNGSIKFDNKSEIIEFLKHPNGFQVWKEYAGEISRHYLLKHDSHISMLGNINRRPLEMFAVKPQGVSVIQDMRDFFPATYIVPSGAGHGTYDRKRIKNTERFFHGNLKELGHIMGFSSRATNIEGDSPIEAAALSARQQIEGAVHNLQVLKQGGRLSLIVSFKGTAGDIDEDTHKSRKKRIYEDLSGSSKAGAIAVISAEDTDVKEVGKTNKDMDYAKLDEVASQAIYLRYKIPLPMVTVKASTFNNMENAVGFFYDFAVLPHADFMFAGLSKLLIKRFGLDPNVNRITYNPESITALAKRRMEELERRKKVNIETTNELRTFLPGREPVENGDILYQAANLVPVGDDLFTDDNTNTVEEETRKLLERDRLT